MAYRIFISHGWADRWVAEQIARRVKEDAGADIFIDIYDIAKGDDSSSASSANCRHATSCSFC